MNNSQQIGGAGILKSRKLKLPEGLICAQARCITICLLISFALTQNATSQTQVQDHFEAGNVDESYGEENEWSKSIMFYNVNGYAEKPKETIEYEVHVHRIEPDFIGEMYTICGSLKYKLAGSKLPSNANWFQGIAIHLPLDPTEDPKWVNAVSENNALTQCTAIDPKGNFSITFDVNKTLRDPKNLSSFAFAYSFGESRMRRQRKDEIKVTWQSKDKCFRSLKSKINIPARASIPIEIRNLHNARDWPESCDATHLLGAVNALQPLGKDRALLAIETYLNRSRSNDDWDAQNHIFWVLRLLFEPVNIDHNIPQPGISFHFANDFSWKVWPLAPLVVECEIPFMLGSRVGGSGIPESPESHVRWAKQFGTITESPYSPIGNPLRVVDQFSRRKKVREFEETSSIVRLMRTQACQMVGVPAVKDEFGYVEIPVDDESWKGYLSSSYADCVWNAASQKFDLAESK